MWENVPGLERGRGWRGTPQPLWEVLFERRGRRVLWPMRTSEARRSLSMREREELRMGSEVRETPARPELWAAMTA